MDRQRKRRWSQEVTRRSNALDLEAGVFTWKDPKRIARSLKRSAEASRRRKADSFRSALSMLTFLREPRRAEPVTTTAAHADGCQR
jgi:hypothetical protein